MIFYRDVSQVWTATDGSNVDVSYQRFPDGSYNYKLVKIMWDPDREIRQRVVLDDQVTKVTQPLEFSGAFSVKTFPLHLNPVLVSVNFAEKLKKLQFGGFPHDLVDHPPLEVTCALEILAILTKSAPEWFEDVRDGGQNAWREEGPDSLRPKPETRRLRAFLDTSTTPTRKRKGGKQGPGSNSDEPLVLTPPEYDDEYLEAALGIATRSSSSGMGLSLPVDSSKAPSKPRKKSKLGRGTARPEKTVLSGFPASSSLYRRQSRTATGHRLGEGSGTAPAPVSTGPIVMDTNKGMGSKGKGKDNGSSSWDDSET